MLRATHAAGLVLLLLSTVTVARAQDGAHAADQPTTEEPNPTRLDVERLPPEAIAITRDLYSHGFFAEGMIGGRGFVGGVGRLSLPGVYTSVGFGYEITRWLLAKVSVEGSFHATNAPPPPSPTSFEDIGAIAELRLQLDVSARVALWLGGQLGVVSTTGDVLSAYGFGQSGGIGLVYGGQIGFDWHFVERHYSMGLAGGARLSPSLDGPNGDRAIAVNSTLYLRYVF